MSTIGFDLDGTMTPNWWSDRFKDPNEWQKKISTDEILLSEMNQMLLGLIPTMTPIAPVFIITNRSVRYFGKVTTEWIDLHEIKIIQLHMVIDICVGDERILRKADVINNLGLRFYFEDEAEIRGRLHYLCPDTHILPPEEAIRLGFAKKMHIL